VPDAGTLCRLLEQTGPASGWLAALLIDVAGRRRVREAVPALVAKLQADDDELPGLAAAALARVGDPEAARRIRREFPDAPFHFRLYACEALGYLKHPESEAAALDLLEREEDEGIRMWLCVALSDLVSERTVEVLSREVERSHSDEVFRELCGPALIASTLLGVDPPRDAGHWRQERARQRAAIAAASVPSPDTQTASAQKITPPAAATRQERLGPEVAVLPENTRHRVGRNDPCPCGSGKKYKKCCGQAG
jgi:HEAT repeat protein